MSNKVKAIVLDVDGVIIGEKIGFNSPDPHPLVIDALKTIQNQGVPIILCTAKPHFAIRKLIKDANLDNFHIVDGGGVIIDPLNHQVLQKHPIPQSTAKKVISALLSHNIYTELYTVDNYYIQSSQKCEITPKHTLVIQTPPEEVDSLYEAIDRLEVTKIMPIALDPSDKLRVDQILQPHIPDVVVSWGVHPVILPLQFGIVTAPGISKSIAATIILKHLSVSPQDTLGIGDSTSDWQFIDPCGYGVAMGNASAELQQLVLGKGIGHSFVAPSVDEHGLITAFKHFRLLD